MVTIKEIPQHLRQFRLLVDKSGNVIVPLDNNGNRDYGAVQRHYRIFVKEWSTEELSMRYTDALKLLKGEDGDDEDEETKVTARWIRLMEQQNKVPVNPKRRWVLAMLLGIPAASFGLAPIDDSFTKRQTMATIQRKPGKPLDIAEYTTFLQLSWQSSWEHMNATGAQSILDDIQRRIERLHQEVLYEKKDDYKQMMRLLCYYHQLDARIAGDLMHLSDALSSMNKAYRNAKLLKSYELQALVLYRRGYIYFRNGYTQIACDDFDAAKKLLPHISRPLRGDILLAAGQGHAFLAQTDTERKSFLSLLDEAYNNIGETKIDEVEHFMGFDESVYMLDRAGALTGSPMVKYRNASEASELITKLTLPSNSPRRKAAICRIEAKIYLDKGYHKMAATHAIDALSSMSYAWNIVDMGMLHQRLQESKYANLKEVTDLGLVLLKARQPQIFN
jgi:tetratricopeptide (TPR) repeat protein